MIADKPVICILYGSGHITGAFVAARREAELMGDEVRFLLILSSNGRIAEAELGSFEAVFYLPIYGASRRLLGRIGYLPAVLYSAWKIRRLLWRYSCERVQINGFRLLHGTALRLLGFRGRIVTWVRMEPNRFGRAGRVWIALARRSSDQLVAVSQFVRASIAHTDRVAVVYDPAPEMPFLGPNRNPVLVFLGRYQPWKGQHVAIEAFHAIAARHPSAQLVFHGNETEDSASSAYFTELRERAGKGSGAGQIHFKPFADPEEAFAAARAALCLSVSEPFGLVCQEASSLGVPVIATRSGGPEEIIEDNQTGYLVSVGDVAAISDRMERLLNDMALAESMGKAGARLMRARFDAEDFKSKMRKLFSLGPSEMRHVGDYCER